MIFDRDARNALQRTVASLRDVLHEDMTEQLRRLGIQESGQVLDLDAITGLTEGDRQTGEAMRALLDHYIAGEQRGTEAEKRRAGHGRMVREIGFSHLNRLIAIRMAEERGILAAPAVGGGFDSDGFQVYEMVANGALGSRYETYRAFIDALFDEAALDLPALFDRSDIRMRIFPSEHALGQIFSAINAPDIAPLWSEDEAIGWVYQYYNDPVERREMRSHGAPRNSRELAVRNQFFTPRYVVEFLTDNTLGRTWYEMRKGDTSLVDTSRYLVRRKHPIWLNEGEQEPEPFPINPDFERETEDRKNPDRIWTRPNPAFDRFDKGLITYAQTFDGYHYAETVLGCDLDEAVHEIKERHSSTGQWTGSFEELRLALFHEQRADYLQGGIDDESFDLRIVALNKALCEQWDIEVETIRHRPKKDPRLLRILDPACGSAHFLLYAFDVLQIIYEEAYDDPDLGPNLQRARPDRVEYGREIPRLILENNLHGIDIDPRAVQIASLALWLRAQRAWHEVGVDVVDRPRVRKTRIVTAEPMPGEREMLKEYREKVDPRLKDLVLQVWDRMKLAGEAGSLLKIEEEIREAVEAAGKESLVPDQVAQMTLHDGHQAPRQQAIQLAAKDEIAFWNEAEGQLFEALRSYSEHAANGERLQRRLFADDAVQGFAFIDLCRITYDVVLMNPPFGAVTNASKEYIDAAFPRTRNDMFSAFIERWLYRLHQHGLLGAITSRTGFFLGSFETWRKEIVFEEAFPTVVADLGFGVLDAMVETAAYCLSFARGSQRRLGAMR